MSGFFMTPPPDFLRDPFHPKTARKALIQRGYGRSRLGSTGAPRPPRVTSLSARGQSPQPRERLSHGFFQGVLHGDPFAVFPPVIGTRDLARRFEFGQGLSGGIACPDFPLGRSVPDGSVRDRAKPVDFDR